MGLLAVGAALWPVSGGRAAFQAADPVRDWQQAVAQARLGEGLAPYALSRLLRAAAQRHADDLAAHHLTSHTGSDGSTPEKRIADAGYLAWVLDDSGPTVGEVLWIGQGGVADALAFFLDNETGRAQVLNPIYREMGVGWATADGLTYYVLTFGARPNVLPVFINDDDISTDDPQVALTLTNEEARPEGEGTIFMGRAIEVRVSNEPDFSAGTWQSWEPLIPWEIPATPGEHTVYVQYRDGAGRTAAAADSIIFGEGTIVPPTIPPLTAAAPVSTTPTAPPTPTPGGPLLPTVTSIPTGIPGYLPPAAEGTPFFPTWTPLPTATVPVTDEPPPPTGPLGVAAALQGAAILIGLYLALRRTRS